MTQRNNQAEDTPTADEKKLDNMTAGTHFIIITITDLAGNEASDVVIVSILLESTATTDAQFQQILILGLGIGGGVIISVIDIIIIKKK